MTGERIKQYGDGSVDLGDGRGRQWPAASIEAKRRLSSTRFLHADRHVNYNVLITDAVGRVRRLQRVVWIDLDTATFAELVPWAATLTQTRVGRQIPFPGDDWPTRVSQAKCIHVDHDRKLVLIELAESIDPQ